MKYTKILLLITEFLCLAFQAWAQPVSDSQTNTMEITLTPTQFLAVVTPTSPGTARVVSFYSQGFSDSIFSPFRDYYTSSGTPVVGGIISTPTKLRYSSENAFHDILRHRSGIAVFPVCIFSIIQDQ